MIAGIPWAVVWMLLVPLAILGLVGFIWCCILTERFRMGSAGEQEEPVQRAVGKRTPPRVPRHPRRSR